MDCRTLISSLVNSLAWPGAVVLLALILKKELSKVLGNLTRLQWKDASADFHRDIKELEAKVEPPPSTEVTTVTPGLEEAYAAHMAEEAARDLASFAPSAAVVDTWNQVEQAMNRAASRIGMPSSSMVRGRGRRLLNSLDVFGNIDPKTVETIESLYNLRNQAVHASDIGEKVSVPDARTYRDLARSVIDDLNKLTAREKPKYRS